MSLHFRGSNWYFSRHARIVAALCTLNRCHSRIVAAFLTVSRCTRLLRGFMLGKASLSHCRCIVATRRGCRCCRRRSCFTRFSWTSLTRLSVTLAFSLHFLCPTHHFARHARIVAALCTLNRCHSRIVAAFLTVSRCTRVLRGFMLGKAPLSHCRWLSESLPRAGTFQTDRSTFLVNFFIAKCSF